MYAIQIKSDKPIYGEFSEGGFVEDWEEVKNVSLKQDVVNTKEGATEYRCIFNSMQRSKVFRHFLVFDSPDYPEVTRQLLKQLGTHSGGSGATSLLDKVDAYSPYARLISTRDIESILVGSWEKVDLGEWSDNVYFYWYNKVSKQILKLVNHYHSDLTLTTYSNKKSFNSQLNILTNIRNIEIEGE